MPERKRRGSTHYQPACGLPHGGGATAALSDLGKPQESRGKSDKACEQGAGTGCQPRHAARRPEKAEEKGLSLF
eukprot:389030-Alexandrium_andersonii.AAC.1